MNTQTIEPIRPQRDERTAFFWEAVDRHELMIIRCGSCGHFNHWPPPMCKKCLSTDLVPTKVSGQGVIYAHTVCVQSFHPWFNDRLPYVLAVIELVEQPGLKLVSNVVGCPPDDVRSGMEVEVVFEQVAEGLTLPFFRPRGGPDRAADGRGPDRAADSRSTVGRGA